MIRPRKKCSAHERWAWLSKRVLPCAFHHMRVVSTTNEECDLERKCLEEVVSSGVSPFKAFLTRVCVFALL